MDEWFEKHGIPTQDGDRYYFFLTEKGTKGVEEMLAELTELRKKVKALEGGVQSDWEKFVSEISSFSEVESAFNYSQKYLEKELVELAISSPPESKVPDWLKSKTGLKKDKSFWFAENRGLL